MGRGARGELGRAGGIGEGWGEFGGTGELGRAGGILRIGESWGNSENCAKGI